MFVCNNCHDKDKDVLKCDIPFNRHTVFEKFDFCDICSKEAELTYCDNYEMREILTTKT